uniref:non-specific serine/threonine protein kinase n=1 Tax=Stomoxys calcitrans TaxID=35570 RepID=A0A1I8QC26_STOCA
MTTTLSSQDMDISSDLAKKTLQDYEVISVIGNGAFGTCFKVRNKETGGLYVWKGIDYDELSESHKESLISETCMLQQLQHPNIVQYYHHLINHEAKSIFIVMEYCEGGDLSKLIAKAKAENKRFEERFIWRTLFQICCALQLCHNKIENGTILHRDIKPANIFLDMEGNAKLGDFGLARMLRRNEAFAESFVGTPYYMSPEIVKGSKYDRKSDVWALGCLIYEMCALRPPFKGKEFPQLSANISNGKFTNIPKIYSKDLQEIIACMLEVEHEQRSSIEEITRHRTLVRNINDLGKKFPRLIDIENVEHNLHVVTEGRCNLECSPLRDFSSTTFSEQNSFHEGCGQRSLSITGVFTPDLRAELFYSAKQRIFPINFKLQVSDPELYETIRRQEYATIDETIKLVTKECDHVNRDDNSPHLKTRDIFDSVIQDRLHALRAQEFLLQQKEETLIAREQQLNEKEKRLFAYEQRLVAKYKAINEEQSMKMNCTTRPPKSLTESCRISLTKFEVNPGMPPPIPPRKPISHDETYCTIELNDSSLLQQPTVAKLDLSALPARKAFSALRKVTFQSPKKFITFDIDSETSKVTAPPTTNQMQTSVSSKGSDESTESSSTTSSSKHRRKSILSLFGLSRKSKEDNNHPMKTRTIPSKVPPNAIQDRIISREECVLSKCRTTELTKIWTKEHKKTAFEMLAALNASGRFEDGSNNANIAPRHKIRQSVRERGTLQRNRMRRFLMAHNQHRAMRPPEQIVL